jgi:hypothetical protein
MSPKEKKTTYVLCSGTDEDSDHGFILLLDNIPKGLGFLFST